MAVNMHAPNMTNWWVWGGAVVAAIIMIAGLGYEFDWFGSGVTDKVVPGIEQIAPATE